MTALQDLIEYIRREALEYVLHTNLRALEIDTKVIIEKKTLYRRYDFDIWVLCMLGGTEAIVVDQNSLCIDPSCRLRRLVEGYVCIVGLLRTYQLGGDLGGLGTNIDADIEDGIWQFSKVSSRL